MRFRFRRKIRWTLAKKLGLGFGTLILRLTVAKARARGMSRLRITCDSDNVASVKVIERNDGMLSGEAVSEITGRRIRQYWIDL